MDSLYNIQGRKYLLTSNGLNKLKELYETGNSQITIANIFNINFLVFFIIHLFRYSTTKKEKIK